MNDKLDEMWTALAKHQPAPSYAAAWQRMLVEKTSAAAWAACDAVDAAPPAASDAAVWAASDAAAEVAAAMAGAAASEAAWAASDEAWAAAGLGVRGWADHYAQRAIDAIKEVQP